jgi:hypothetical protein
METVLIEISNQKAYKLLEDLEALHILKVLKKSKQPVTIGQDKKKKPSAFFGTLSREEGEKMQAYILQSRTEWERSI